MRRRAVGVVALLALTSAAIAISLRPAKMPLRREPQSGRPDTFIFVVDALRADHVGCLGYERPTTPNLDAFARDAVLFANAQTPSTWTRPAIASMLTGAAALRHQVLTHDDALPPTLPVLPASLHAEGYRTIAVQTNGNAGPSFGFQRGFDVFRLAAPDRATGAWANGQLRGLLTDGPIFAYIHIIEPHSPYAPSRDGRARFDSGARGKCDGSVASLTKAKRMWPRLNDQDIKHLIDLYDGEVWDADRAVGDFLAILKKAGRYESSLIIVTADHGEAFAEHKTLEHGRTLNAEEMHIPLIVRFPGGRHSGRRVEAPASLLDVMPTVLTEAGIRPDNSLTGWDLGAMVEERCPPRALYAYVCADNPKERELLGILDGDGYKRVMDTSNRHWVPSEALGLWNTRSDRQEKHNLCEQDRDLARAATLALKDWARGERSKAAAPARATVSEQTREQLRALGYVH